MATTKEYHDYVMKCLNKAGEVTSKKMMGGVLPVKFDVAKLKANLSLLPSGYELKKIDSELYDKCFENPETVDFVSTFGTKEKYLELGRGVVALKDRKIVAGASSYTRYKNGIEIEVDTLESERRNHLATVCCSALISFCRKAYSLKTRF